MLITVDGASFAYGGNLIFENVCFAVNEGERVGLIGANGEGKTTLIKLMLGRLDCESGSVIRKNGIRLGYLEQNGGYESGNTVYGEMLAIFGEELAAVEKLNSLSKQLSALDYNGKEYAALSAKIAAVEAYVSARDCYGVEVRIKTVLNGMGFADKYYQTIDSMSGGEKTRLKLARLLLEQPDLLILDEPTNHLDAETLFWLEDYLKGFKGAIFVVSHDRYFLDKTVHRILEIENKTLLSFSGNYTKYKTLKAEYVARRLKEYEAQQEERAKLQDYVDRNIVRATTAKSAQSRIKQLQRMEILEKPYVPPRPPKFKFVYDNGPYENVLEIKNLTLSRGNKTLLKNANLLLKRGKKVALVGANGTGKSTLLKEVVNGNGAIALGRFVRIGYYDQEGLNLDESQTVLDELWGRHLGYTQTEARAELARCGLFAEDMQKCVKTLSGGERAKLALCILECERGNFLILDEPTNHLDLPAREGLEEALKEFDGTLLFVSHDRYFISALAEEIVEIEDGALSVYEGGYEGYQAGKALKEQDKRAEREHLQKNAEAAKSASYRSKADRAEAERKKQLVKKLECEISALESEEEQLNSRLALPEVAADFKEVEKILKKLEAIKLQLDDLYLQFSKLI